MGKLRRVCRSVGPVRRVGKNRQSEAIAVDPNGLMHGFSTAANLTVPKLYAFF